jgi:hypothetical protein
VDHIGIYAGNGLMVVAPKTGDVVKVQNVYDTPTAIRRVLPVGGSPGFGSADPAAAGSALWTGDLAAQRASLLAALASFTGAAS